MLRQNLLKENLKASAPDFFVEDPTFEIKRMLYEVSFLMQSRSLLFLPDNECFERVC